LFFHVIPRCLAIFYTRTKYKTFIDRKFIYFSLYAKKGLGLQIFGSLLHSFFHTSFIPIPQPYSKPSPPAYRQGKNLIRIFITFNLLEPK